MRSASWPSFRITPAGQEPLPLTRESDGAFTVGAWTIRAELDASQPARLEVTDPRGHAVLLRYGGLDHRGQHPHPNTREADRELVDVVPASVR